MQNLKGIRFRAIDFAQNSITVEGELQVRDRVTLAPVTKEDANHNGYVLCIETTAGVHIVAPDSIELVEKI